MRSRSRLRLMLGAGLAAATVAVGVVPALAGAAPAPYCGITWGSLAKSAQQLTGAPVTAARVGRHDCFDRLVVDLAGRPAAGFNVRYTDVFRAEGTGDPIVTAGGAVLHVTVHAPAYDIDGRSTVPGGGRALEIRSQRFQDGGFRTFRDLVWGGTYEGYTSLGLGVRARLPFRVFQLDGPGNGSRLVIDVAHRW